ncbi:hypothetical protein [Streptomyces sp. NPDC052496]|uniref:hypothetical protein n=1 Tax=Streptomyces sp. NPDC052496 TaxID=3154951 RepID=UPI0034198D4C
MGVERAGSKDYLYYAPDWIWPANHEGCIKSLLLFFDGVALSLPADLAAETLDRSPDLAQPLHDQGLLINLDPHTCLSPEAASTLARGLTDWLESRPRRRPPDPHAAAAIASLHWARHWSTNPEAERFIQVMRRQGLTFRSANGLWHIDQDVRLMILMAYCRALHREMQASDITLQPVMRDMQSFPGSVGPAFRDLERPAQKGWRRNQVMHRVIRADWREVGVDLSRVPLGEILDFRNRHGADYRAYAEGLRQLVRASEEMSDTQFAAALRDRSEQIEHAAAELRRSLRMAFGHTSAALIFSIAGATWTAAQGDVSAALLAVASAIAATTRPPRPVTAYSYLYHMKKRY